VRAHIFDRSVTRIVTDLIRLFVKWTKLKQYLTFHFIGHSPSNIF
jgi:hypothetical protein